MQLAPVLKYGSWHLEQNVMCFKSWNISNEKNYCKKYYIHMVKHYICDNMEFYVFSNLV